MPCTVILTNPKVACCWYITVFFFASSKELFKQGSIVTECFGMNTCSFASATTSAIMCIGELLWRLIPQVCAALGRGQELRSCLASWSWLDPPAPTPSCAAAPDPVSVLSDLFRGTCLPAPGTENGKRERKTSSDPRTTFVQFIMNYSDPVSELSYLVYKLPVWVI